METISLPLLDFPSINMNLQPKLPQHQPNVVQEPISSQEKESEPNFFMPITQELRAYTRRHQPQGKKYNIEPQRCHECNLVVSKSIGNSGDFSDASSHDHDNLDLPIAFTKGTKTCTLHPISNFVSYEKLSPSFRAFTIKMSNMWIPRFI